MSEWNPVDELPPRQYRHVSADDPRGDRSDYESTGGDQRCLRR